MQTKSLPGECQHCGGPLVFPADEIGTTSVCRHCGQPTELRLALPPGTGSSGRAKAVGFTVILLVILLGGLGGAIWALKRAQRMSARLQAARAGSVSPMVSQSADAFAAAGFRVGPVRLEKASGSATGHAVGTIANLLNRQRLGVRVELDLLDARGDQVGVATDYQPALKPNAEWQFRAMVSEKQAVAARIVAIKENR